MNLSVAVDNRVKRDGQWVKETLWVDVTMFGARAEPLARFCTKGRQVAACGRLGLRTFEARDGTQKTVLELIAEDIEPLGERTDRSDGAERQSQPRNFDSQPRNTFGGTHRDELAGQPTRGGAGARQQDFGAHARNQDGAAADSPVYDDDIPF